MHEPLTLYNALYMPSTRTQIYLTEEQRRRLDEIVARQGRGLAQVVRDAVDLYLETPQVDPAPTLKLTFGALPNLSVPSRDEWDRG